MSLLKFIFRNERPTTDKLKYFQADNGALTLINYLTSKIPTVNQPWSEVYPLSILNMRCETIAEYKLNKTKNVDVTYVELCCIMYRPGTIARILKGFDYILCISNEDMGLLLNEPIQNDVHKHIESNSKVNGTKILFDGETEKPLEYFFAKEFLSQQHIDRDMLPEEHIEIAEKFDLMKYKAKNETTTK